MGSSVTIAVRTSKGGILSADSYSHVMERIIKETDLVSPNERSFVKLVKEYLNREDYGPYPLKLQDGGIFFVDFKSKTIFNAQTISLFPALSNSVVRDLIFNKSRLLSKYASHITHVADYKRKNGRMVWPPKLVKQRVERVDTLRQLWPAIGSKASAWKLNKYIEGEIVTVGRFMLPEREFGYLLVKLPGWKVISYDIDLKSDLVKLKSDVLKIVGVNCVVPDYLENSAR